MEWKFHRDGLGGSETERTECVNLYERGVVLTLV